MLGQLLVALDERTQRSARRVVLAVNDEGAEGVIVCGRQVCGPLRPWSLQRRAPFRQRRCFVPLLCVGSAGDLCAQEALGTAVAAAIEAKGSKALYVKADLAVVDDVKNIIAQTDATFGRLNGLVNSAAVATRGFVSAYRFAVVGVMQWASSWPSGEGPSARSSSRSRTERLGQRNVK